MKIPLHLYNTTVIHSKKRSSTVKVNLHVSTKDGQKRVSVILPASIYITIHYFQIHANSKSVALHTVCNSKCYTLVASQQTALDANRPK